MTLVPADAGRPVWIELMGPAGQLADKICETEFVPARLRKRPAAVMACILSGQEAGIGPMQSLRQIFVTDDGKVGMAAELMRSLVLREGHEIWPEEINNTRCTMAGRRRGQESPTRITWTMDDAKKANLSGKQNWSKYPRAMLTARATTELCRLLFPDVIAGISYSLEELEDDDLDAPPAAPTPGPDGSPKTQTRKASAARPARAKKGEAAAATPSVPPPPLPDEDDDPPTGGTRRPRQPGPAPSGAAMPTPQRIAMRAREAGIDHHDVVAAVTFGTKRSSMDCTPEEQAAVLEFIGRIERAELELVYQNEDGAWPVLREVQADDDIEDADIVEEDEPPLPEEVPPTTWPPVDEWTGSTWRAYLDERGVRISDVIKEGYRLAPDYDCVPPVTLDQLAQRKNLAAAMKDYVDAFGRDSAA